MEPPPAPARPHAQAFARALGAALDAAPSPAPPGPAPRPDALFRAPTHAVVVDAREPGPADRLRLTARRRRELCAALGVPALFVEVEVPAGPAAVARVARSVRAALGLPPDRLPPLGAARRVRRFRAGGGPGGPGAVQPAGG